MDVTPLIPKGHQIVDAYGDGGFKVTGERHDGSVLIFAEHTHPWSVSDWSAVTPQDFDAIFAADPLPEIVVVGCGANFQMVPKALRLHFQRHRIAVDVMDTGAACRTYNILLAEGRRVAAALIAV